MRSLLYFIILVSIFFTGCSEEDGSSSDSSTEVVCSTATGTWNITSATCNGTAVSDVGTISLIFNSTVSVTQTMGSALCTSTSDWTLALGSFQPTLSLTGVGNLRCSTTGTSVSSCSTTDNSCNTTTDITNFINNYETCAISSGTSMVLIRTVSSANDPNGLSYCLSGESERITLTQSTTTPSTNAVLDIAGIDPADLGTVATSGNSQLTLVMTNSGLVAATAISATGLAAPFNFLGGSYPGTGGTCAATLAASSSCNLVVSFNPTSVGAFNDTIDFSYNDGAATQSFTHGLSGTGTSASLAILNISEANPYDYGSRAVGASQTHTFTVINSGAATATAISETGLASPFNFTGGSYPGTGGTCALTLAAAASCTLTIAYSPVSTGLQTDTINLNYNDGASAQNSTRSVQGTGVAPGLLVISSGPTYDYGSVQVGNNSNFVFTVTNAGGFTATSISGSGLASPFAFFGGSYPGISGTCGITLAAGGSCTIDVVYSPLSLGVASDTILLDYNDGASAQQASRNIQGTGTP